jgi:cyclopropane fatty-acyl-phospholipid synthase-like methyltransferase
MTTRASISRAYFEELYAREEDPWRFASSAYEHEKYATTLAALPKAKYESAFEIGCSLGVLTQRLAERCESLLAVDVADAALARVRARCAGLDHVQIRQMHIPNEWPDDSFDLVVVSELLYFLTPADIMLTAARSRDCLRPGGAVVLVHYILPTDYPSTGDEAAETFIGGIGLSPILQLRKARYRLDLLRG